MKKKISFYAVVLTMCFCLTGCGKEKVENPTLSICNQLDTITTQYENNEIDKKQLINKLSELENECTMDLDLCTVISPGFMNENTSDEIIDAHLLNIDVECEKEADKYE